jgi:hypothetical protein
MHCTAYECKELWDHSQLTTGNKGVTGVEWFSSLLEEKPLIKYV